MSADDRPFPHSIASAMESISNDNRKLTDFVAKIDGEYVSLKNWEAQMLYTVEGDRAFIIIRERTGENHPVVTSNEVFYALERVDDLDD